MGRKRIHSSMTSTARCEAQGGKAGSEKGSVYDLQGSPHSDDCWEHVSGGQSRLSQVVA